MSLRGRHWVAVWLLAFLAAAGLVVARTTAGLRLARALAESRVTRAGLEGRRGELEQRVRAARGRRTLVPLAQRRGLRLPSDSEIILIPVPPARAPR